MKTTRKLFCCLLSAVCCLLSAASSAYADTESGVKYYPVLFDTTTTTDGGLKYDWEVADVTPGHPDTINSGSVEKGKTFQWSYLENASYDTAFAPSGKGLGTNWISAPWISTDVESRIPNGFYAYKLSLWSDAPAAAANGVLKLTEYLSDDYTVAIYFNDLELDISGAEKNANGWLRSQEFTFSGLTVKSGLNDIIFVVHNTDGGSTNTKDNASGISLYAELLSSVEFKNPESGGSTPEPATLLIIGLGIAGLGLARRRK